MAYTWHFFRAGGFDQVDLRSGHDLAHLDQLDRKLWLALSCPTRGLEFDERTLAFIDANGDKRIRAPEIIEAARWITTVLKNPDTLMEGRSTVALTEINDGTDEGKNLLASARQILHDLGKADAKAISVDDVADTVALFAQTLFNGDGIVVPASAEQDDATRAVIEEILTTIGGTPDRCGTDGIGRAQRDAFFDALKAFEAWSTQAQSNPDILCLGEHTASANAAVEAVTAKIDDYFARTGLAAFDSRAIDLVNRPLSELEGVTARAMDLGDEGIAALPLAHVAPDADLPLSSGLNPAWREAIATFRDTVVVALLGEGVEHLSPEAWTQIRTKFAAFRDWQAAAAGQEIAPLGLDRAREILASPAFDAIEALIARDEALAVEFDAIASVDRLVRYHRDLWQLLNNFISFKPFYQHTAKAIFQIGTLYIDQRSAELVMRVEDAGKHASLATLSGMYLVYCDVTRKATGEQMAIAAAITGGDADNLMIGRNGLFIDRQGRDWDATITNIISHPISLRQAFWLPYKTAIRFVEEQIGKFASDKASSLDQAAADAISSTSAEAEAPPPFDVAKFAGIFAAIGLALGAIGTALASIIGAFLSLAYWQMPIAIAGLMLIISGPSMLMAWLQLRKRNLAPLLDANGWAINTNALINVPFGESLTGIAKLPEGAKRSLQDPFANKNRGAKVTIIAISLIIALLFAWFFGAFRSIAPWIPASSWSEAHEAAAAEEAAKAEAAAAEEAAKAEAAAEAQAKADAEAQAAETPAED